MRTNHYDSKWFDDFERWTKDDAFLTYLDQAYDYLGGKPGNLWGVYYE